MLAIEYKRLSANKSIVFTCFLISFLSVITKTTFSQTAKEGKTDVSLNNASHTIPASHQTLKNQVLFFLQNQLLLASPGHIEGDLRIQVRDVDKRIDIPYCDTPYEFETNNNASQQSNVSVKVSCNNTNWYLFMHASVAVIQEVVVTSDNLSPGTLLSKRNLKVIEVDKNRLRGSTFTSIDEIVGARIKRRVRAGNIIDDRMLCFVCKGDRITIAAVSSGLSITVYGVAQEDGVLGDTIQVRNISSDKLIYGKIASTSQVEISI
jgi:flagella basal body P-ring formation protein FlgA